MKNLAKSLCLLVIIAAGSVIFSAHNGPQNTNPTYKFPFAKAGLSSHEAAAHLLSRFSFGAKPGQVDEVVKMGLEKWFQQQLLADANEAVVNKKLAGYESLGMTNEEIVQTFPRPAQLLRKAIRDGAVERDSIGNNKKDYRKELKAYMDKNDMKPLQELLRQLINQKIIRATYSDNQLQEVLTDFWFNHFNVSLTKGEIRQYVTVYERDAIRPNVLGRFENMLLATAKSPAMLAYLDNAKSTVNEENATGVQKKVAERREEMMEKMMTEGAQKNEKGKVKVPKMQGLNENYAREIMELHTMGVDGGYTQQDVTQAARVLTGWTINPEIEYSVKAKQKPNEQRLRKLGVIMDGDFVFAANKHDKQEKKVLGITFPAGGGYDEGVKLIRMLAAHKSTAKFISRKMAVRFVSDNPPQSMVDKMAKTFLETNGDIKEVLITMTTSAEFWNKEALREKTKSPFELAISAVRSLNAEVNAPYQLYTWITKMGQQIYFYQAPTGFPDRGQYWINTGALLNRMNFGLALASERIPGVRVNLLALNNNHEPESAEAALKIYGRLLMPARNLDETVKRLTPMLTDPDLVKKVDEAAENAPPPTVAMQADENEDELMMNEEKGNDKAKKQQRKQARADAVQSAMGNNTMLSQVAGIIIGSPEFQRR
jgi:uncharacterized protein (DUF1800 family)